MKPERCCAGSWRGYCIEQDTLQQDVVNWENKLSKLVQFFDATSQEEVRNFRVKDTEVYFERVSCICRKASSLTTRLLCSC